MGCYQRSSIFQWKQPLAGRIPVHVVLMSCIWCSEEQHKEYKRSIFLWDKWPVVSFGAMLTHGWAKYATVSIGQLTFGMTVVVEAMFLHFKIATEHIVERVPNYLEMLAARNAHMIPWQNI
jgi:transketolase